MKYRPGWMVFSSFTVHPGRGAQRAPPPPRPASMDVPASRTRAKLPPVAVFHVSSTAPPCARVSPSAAAARLLTRRGMAGTRAAQSRAVALPRRRLAALGLHPVALWVNRRRFDGLAAPTVAACLRHVPARRRHVLLELAWHGRCACVCLQYNGISAHTTATFPGKVKVHLRRLSMRVYCVWMGLANSLLRAGGRGTRQRTLAYSSENAPATPARVNRNTMFRISSGRSVCNQLLDADRTPKPSGRHQMLDKSSDK